MNTVRRAESIRDLAQNILFIHFKNIFTHEFERVFKKLLNGISYINKKLRN